MNGKRNVWLAAALLIVFAITRWPGLLPPNFSAVYALVFCAGVFFRTRAGWWMPLVVLAVTDVALNVFYYKVPLQPFQLVNYVFYIGLLWLGRRFKPRHSIALLVGGSLIGALLFYILTNTASWLFNPFGNPEYHVKSLASWVIALTKGAGSWPQTWEFFRNTLMSSGLFTALFAAAFKYSEHLESAAEKKAAEATSDEEESAAEPEESKA
jgi:hypothetical protein